MKKLIIDRLEGKYFICKDKEKKLFAIEIEEMPKDAKIRDHISIDDEGSITLDK